MTLALVRRVTQVTDANSVQNREPPRKRRQARLHFKVEWKLRYLMLPVNETEEMIHLCIQCIEKIKCRSTTATRHITSFVQKQASKPAGSLRVSP